MQCYYCSAEIETKEKITRQQTCPSCGNPLHCCRNCTFYDEKAYHQCKETEAEWVSDKQSANFCDYFKPAQCLQGRKKMGRDQAEEKLKQMLRDLNASDESAE